MLMAIKLKTKRELNHFLEVEKDQIGKNYLKHFFFPPYNWKLIKVLRELEYHHNNSGAYHKLMVLIKYVKYRKLTALTGVNIPINTCDIGLTIYHIGSITINSTTQIGRNCCIMNNVNIGANGGSSISPTIGDNVYIGPGAVLYGDIKIADGCYIGANAVVNKSFEDPCSVIAGVPAKVIGKDYLHWWEKNKLNRTK